MAYPAPPSRVHLPASFSTQRGSLYQTFPTLSPLAKLPVGISNVVKLPTWGRCLGSVIQASFTPSSVAVRPKAFVPVPEGAKAGLFDGKTPPSGKTACNCTLGMAPQLNSNAGPRVSYSTGVPSMLPKR